MRNSSGGLGKAGTTDIFKDMFAGAELEIEDLYLVESFQVAYLPGWVPEEELGVVLNRRPEIGRYLLKQNPGIRGFLKRADSRASKEFNQLSFDLAYDAVVWTITDLLAYNKCPEIYDQLPFHGWNFRQVTDVTELNGKVVIDGGL